MASKKIVAPRRTNPSSSRSVGGRDIRSTQTLSTATIRTLRPPRDPALRLSFGLLLPNAPSGRQYRVGKLLGTGGFGAVYEALHVAGGKPLPTKCVLKVANDPQAWHREAYFGDLLKEESGIVRVHESFAWVPRGPIAKPLYCLILELVEGGDLHHYLQKHPDPWPEAKARREIIRLLRAVTLLHSASAVHRDITPGNVFVTRDRVLKLGDFGIARHSVGEKNVRADAFAPLFAPTAIQRRQTRSWRPADDVYQVGCLFAALLCGSAEYRVTSNLVKNVSCSPEAKSVIQRSIGDRRKRFTDSREMLAGLERQESRTRSSRGIRSFMGRHVVFTGRLGVSRGEAKRLVRRAGGIPEDRVTHSTDVVVVGGQSPHWKAEKKGQKLLDIDYERDLGHTIALIDERRFIALVTIEE